MSSIYSFPFAYGRAPEPTACPFTSEGTPSAPSPFPPLRRLRKKYYERGLILLVLAFFYFEYLT